MKTDTYRRLCRLHERFGAREFGKICQKLVALAFRLGGCPHVVERGVQGVDVDAAWRDEKYAVEIKTTEKKHVEIAAKDIAGLASRCTDGYQPLVGILRLGPLADWLLIDAGCLSTGSLEIELLRAYRRRDLEQRLHPHFDATVVQHFEATLLESQAYLDRVLREAGVEVLHIDRSERDSG